MKFTNAITTLLISCLGGLTGCMTDPVTDLNAAPTAVSRGSTSATCWDGVTLPRPALEPGALASVAAKYAAYTDALVAYEAAAAAFSIEAQQHADAYNTYAQPITGRLCNTSVDCDTGNAAFTGSCVQPYYGVGARCYVIDNTPLPAGPQPPVIPAIGCGDLFCPTGTSYACETEPTTGVNACVMQRCLSGGGGGGGGRRP